MLQRDIMGISVSKEKKESNRINKELEKLKTEDDKTIKLLLLGPGECGKSTILKQMQIIHNKGFSKSDLLPYKPVIFNNIINAVYVIAGAIEKYQIDIGDLELKNFALSLVPQIEAFEISIPFSPEVHRGIKRLWDNKIIKEEISSRSAELQVEDSAKYFLDELDRIQDQDFIPTEQDVLRARASTSGVIEVQFVQKKTKFRVFDVGGQKSERRKWIHCFDNVTAIIFMAAISEYDRYLREDNTINRMIDTLELFETVCNNQYFVNTDFTLFLNKIDLFKEKIKQKPLTLAFPNFCDEPTYENCVGYISLEFLRLNKDKKKIRVHQTCATDTEQVNVVIRNIIETLSEKQLASFTTV